MGSNRRSSYYREVMAVHRVRQDVGARMLMGSVAHT